jgi:tripartite-type tricarboxylate transporter receptor subunit TctC
VNTHLVRMAALLLAACAAAPLRAQEFPSRPISLIVPFAAGGASDVIARIVADRMSQNLGQRVINENVPGAGGSTALTRTARAAPDGYTIAIGNSGTSAASYVLYPDLKYTPDAFAPIGLVAKTVPVLAINKDFPAKDLAEFVAYAKANPGRVSLGHAGVGSSNFLICKAFVEAAKVDVTLVSYRGGALALNDLIGGQIDGVCDAAASITGAIQGGQVRGIAVAVPMRLPTLPDVPTSAEGGLPEFQAQGWNALFAPKDTPAPVIARLQSALQASVSGEAMQKRLQELGSFAATPEEATPAYVEKLVPAEIEKFRKLLVGVKL